VATPARVPPPEVGRSIYWASRVGSFESLGILVIACRHRDPAPRSFAVDVFDPRGARATSFGPRRVDGVPAGKKVLFVSRDDYFKDRGAVNMRLGHLGTGTARIASDARDVRCDGRMRFDPGKLHPSWWKGVGLYPAGVGATPLAVQW